MELPDLFSPPLIFCFVQYLLFISIIGFTSPTSIIRPAVVPLIVVCIWKVLPLFPTFLRGPWSVWFAAGILSNFMHYVESALIVKWSFETQSPTASGKPQVSAAITTQTHGGTFWERFRFGYYIITAARNVGTPYMVKGTPEFSTKNPHYVPSRRVFLFQNAITIIFALLAFELERQVAQPLEYNEVVFSEEAVPIFRGSGENLTMEKLLIRSVFVLRYWLILRVGASGLMTLPAFFHIILGTEDVQAYRPNFGPISEAYSVRRFWSIFWHQYMRKFLTASADVVVYKVFQFGNGALITRYFHLSLVFLFSGLLHELVDIAEGFPRSYVGSIHFFMTQAVGIMLEDAVQAAYRAIIGIKRGTPPTLMARAVGYIWLALFLCWSTPMWIYPRQRAIRGEEGENALPFSLLSLLSKI